MREAVHEPPPHRMQRLSRSLGLQAVQLLWRKTLNKSPVEEPKIAILVDLRMACYACYLHIIPVAASITLCVLNWRGYWIGAELRGPSGDDGVKFLALQFASKVTELLAMASLSSIIFTIIRDQLIHDFLPFSALTSGFEFTKLQLLWSKEFLTTCYSEFSSSARKTFLIGTLVVFTILGGTIGPSTATAMMPVFRIWDAGGTEFWMNTTSQGLWPLEMKSVGEHDGSCSSSNDSLCFPSNMDILGEEIVARWPVAADDYIYERFSAIVKNRRSVSRFDITLTTRGFTIAGTASSLVADTLYHIQGLWTIANQYRIIQASSQAAFRYFKLLYVSIQAHHPVTYVACLNQDFDFIRSDPTMSSTLDVLLLNRVDEKMQVEKNGYLEFYTSFNFTGETSPGSSEWLASITGNGTHPGLELHQLDGVGSSGVAIVAVPIEDITYMFACSIDARLANSTTVLTGLTGDEAVGNTIDWQGARYDRDSSGNLSWPQIQLSTEWFNSTNSLNNGQSTMFEAYFSKARDPLSPYGHGLSRIVEGVLAIITTEGLARTNSMSTILGSPKQVPAGNTDSTKWIDEIMPTGKQYSSGGSAFDYTFTSGDNSQRLKAKVQAEGYGYGPAPATIVATTVLLIYSVIAVAFTIFSIGFHRTTSSSWDSIVELVALSMNSRPSAALDNTGAGISNVDTLKQHVRIGVNEARLQIMFEEREDVVKVLPNELYG